MPELMQLILSLPNLRELMIDSISQTEPPASIPPEKTWQREPLQSLELASLQSKDIEFIALCGITSRRIDLSLSDAMIEKIIACSSGTVSELVLHDGYPPISPMTTFPPVARLPPLSALTTMEVRMHSDTLSARLADFLPCIHSAPALTSITFKYPKSTPEDIPSSRIWNDMDKWLARLAMHAKAKRGLTVVLAVWSERNLKWEEFLLEFRKAGAVLLFFWNKQSLYYSWPEAKMQSAVANWRDRAEWIRNPESWQPQRKDLVFAVIRNAQVEHHALTLALFGPNIAVDANGNVLALRDDDFSTLSSLASQTLELPQTGNFRNTWIIRRPTTSQPIERLLVATSEIEVAETSVQGYNNQGEFKLEHPVGDITILPPLLQDLFGLILKSEGRLRPATPQGGYPKRGPRGCGKRVIQGYERSLIC
ncbi:hypothetical protein BDM02DRAFT_3183185 [Thelephora ganbajun]|uniref:Uncharacterized protein n=1 Tax=Thelephora ganbajun TaxID=370292 RepID=A0ACB6ZTD0_THEGA|nr:hypothetical protein BDM02DRAFT_3183185 [Thelephora ganbajun]